MAHFGSGSWVSNYGPIPYSSTATAGSSTSLISGFSKVGAVLNNTVATNSGVTEGTDLATWTVPDAGLYRVTVYTAVGAVASDATAEIVSPAITFTDSVGAKSAVQLQTTGQTLITMNAKTAAAVGMWVVPFRALAAGSVAVKLVNTITSAGRTNGHTINWSAVVEKIGE